MNDLPALRKVEDGAELRVRLKPNSRVEDIEGIDRENDVLIIRVRGKPIKGEANRCLLDFLKKRIGLKRAAIVRGTRSHIKTIHIPSGSKGLDDLERLIGDMR